LVVGGLLVVASATANAAAVRVQTSSATGTTTAAPAWSTQAVTAGNLLVAIVQWQTTAATNGTVTGVPSGWQLAASSANDFGSGTHNYLNVNIYYISNCPMKAQNSTESFTVSSATGLVVQLAEYSGIITSSPLDVTGTAFNAAATSVTVSTSSSATTGPELAIAAYGSDATKNNQGWANASAPYSNIGAGDITAPGSQTVDELGTYDASVSAGAVTASGASSNKSSDMVAAIATFKVATTTYYWIGGAGNALCTAAGNGTNSGFCWSNSSGGSAALSTPTNTNPVIFDSGGTGNCSINAALNVYSIMVTGTGSIYPGTITQGAFNVTLAAGLTLAAGTTGTFKTAAANTVTMSGDLDVQAGTFTGQGGTIGVRALSVSGGTYTQAGSNLTASTSVTLSGGNVTAGAGTTTVATTMALSGANATYGSGSISVTGATTASSGTVSLGSGTNTFSGGLTASGAALTLSTGTTTVTGAATVSLGSMSSGGTFSTTDLFTQSGGTVTITAGSMTLGSAIAALSSSFTMTGGTFTHSAGTLNTTNGTTTDISGTATFNGTGGTQNIKGQLNVTGGSMTLGTAAMNSSRGSPPSNAITDHLVTVSSGGTLTLTTSFTFPQTSSAMTVAGTLNAGSGTVTFATTNAVTVSGTYNANSSTTSFGATDPLTVSGTYSAGSSSSTVNGTMAVSGTYSAGTSTTHFVGTTGLTGIVNANAATLLTFTGAVTMTGTSAFNGNTGTTVFASTTNTFTAGTFTVGDAASAGSVTFSGAASTTTFATGMTLAFPTSGGSLKFPGGSTLASNGKVTASGAGGVSSSPPKITRSSGGTGITVSILAGTLDVDGLEIDFSVAGGMTIASGVTLTKLAHLTFQFNVAAGAVGSRHLVITLGATTVINVPGCFFDTSVEKNVRLLGTSVAVQAHAVFENQNASTNGSGAGESLDDDGDNLDGFPSDNNATNTSSPFFGSVVEWVQASPADTSGTALGPPVPAFDWNTFAFYGVYVAFQDISGGALTDRLWMRNSTTGAASYFYDVLTGSGNIVGAPRFDTVNETTTGVDANGDNDTADTDVHVVYIGTSTGHVIKLIDDGTQLIVPGTFSVWHTDFTSGSVSSITSPLISDGTNIYFGGTGGTSTQIFGVQIAAGVGTEKTLQKHVIAFPSASGTITSAPAWTVYNGATYLILGSPVVSGFAYVYEVQMSPGGTISDSFGESTTNITAAVNLINSRAYAVTAGGQLYAIDASISGTFTKLSGFPYQNSPVSAITAAAFVDPFTNYAYFGDSAGRVFIVKDTGAAFSTISATNYPFQVAGASAVMGTPLYRKGGGTIAIGASDGYLYFVNRQDATGTPQIRKRYFVGTGAVTSVSYNTSTSQYMAASADGHMTYILASDVGTDSDGVE
jgi:hypothetical protein